MNSGIAVAPAPRRAAQRPTKKWFYLRVSLLLAVGIITAIELKLETAERGRNRASQLRVYEERIGQLESKHRLALHERAEAEQLEDEGAARRSLLHDLSEAEQAELQALRERAGALRAEGYQP